MATTKIDVIVDHPFGSLVHRPIRHIFYAEGPVVWLGCKDEKAVPNRTYMIMMLNGECIETVGCDWKLLNEA